jgi:CSLREA domain-containing protein
MAIPRPPAFWLIIQLSLSLPVPAAATTIVVTTTTDDVTVNGNCTLREAVLAANGDATVDACPAGSASDSVILRAGTYRLSLLGSGEHASRSGDLNGAYEVAPAGDLERLTVEVLLLSNLAETRRMGLVLSIKQALIALAGGDAPLACWALGSFQTDVSAYGQDGSLTAAQSSLLAAGAERVEQIICR